MNWCPFGISSFVPSNSSNAGLTFFISLQMASHHRVSPFALSSLMASSTDFGIQMPNLWVRTQYFDFILATIRLRQRSTVGIHQANAGSIAMQDATAYSDT